MTVVSDHRVDGGHAAIPRWATGLDGIAEHRFPVATAVADLAASLGADEDAVVFAAHAVVVGALSGEPVVTIGHGGRARVVDLGRRTWRELVALVPLAPTGSARCDTSVGEGDLDGDAIVHIGLEGGALVVRCRREWVDDDYAARLADYHRTALRLAAADPDTPAAGRCLLGDDELRHQLTGLSGAPRELPDRRVHQLVADTAAARPDDVAVVAGLDRLTYRQLDERANQVAHALLADGLTAEDVVAVVTERSIPWLVAVLGVLKAGGCYLPVEPHFPVERIAAMLTRSACGLALTDDVGRAVLDRLGDLAPGIRSRVVDDVARAGHPSTDPAVAVSAGQLAYIYFTSGSTGEPKGVMCEQEGMLNHVLAKIDDMGLRAGTVVAQTAPQCFDISLWQLLAPLVVGGTVVVVSQQALLDVEQFVGELDRRRVEVAQLVPSYLEVLLGHLERGPRALPALRCVSATGEPLKAALVRRWFAALPEVLLVNAYGLTETCDDTNHEVMSGPPPGARVPLGRAIPGAGVHVVDGNLMPVPLGATGEIVFSGRCLARGYVNDPVRTAQAFTANPHDRGRRIYRSGDFGRWTPDGRLEFSGRRDTQVKIRGFRIEIEEIEDRLLRVPGVREAAVIVADATGTARLVACYSASPSLAPGPLVEALARTLPDYMVPMDWYWLDVLPLTGNGKVDRNELARVTGGLHRVVPRDERPRTDTERRLAAAWAAVLGVAPDRVGRTDDFFASGGSSLSALQLVIALDRACSLGDITGHPVLADLAATLDTAPTGPRPVLYRLTPPAGRTLVCFPYAGGNAVTYLPLAGELAALGWAVYGVEPPGRERGEKPVPVSELAELVADELAALGTGPVSLWGHSTGVAAALAAARLLRLRGHVVDRVHLGAQLPGDGVGRRAQAAEVSELSDREVVRVLAEESGRAELAFVDDVQQGLLADAYRHDVVAACHYLADALDAAALDAGDRLDVPVTVVLVADDDLPGDPWDWSRLARDVRVLELPDGGHYFPASRPATVAGVVAKG
ncbi:amino acid adenylation domain-containing protein [Umezawaea sp. Da 62-37]|uniref:non-ribosomal peptide synthetase family protein n=1 Tax=Umezawaea sp. Da 62-37 TaxID=3075927 RepID=UPI0028F6F3A2|nr:amino acid adenylation domain-containing protein [Umezawaea sp. Da 62-37]WNV85477.1 amino acid adenylation domain-containing protein [Umezawaea sp. Da 62-37]